MAATVFVTVMAAFGFFCFLYVLRGWFLPVGKGCMCVCYGIPDEGMLSRWLWLRNSGMMKIPMVVVTRDLSDPWENCDIELCSPEALLSRLEQERSRIHGTGDGNSSGRHQRRGISEL